MIWDSGMLLALSPCHAPPPPPQMLPPLVRLDNTHALTIRALLKPEKFEKIPARAHPPPRLAVKYPSHAETIEVAAKDRKVARGLPRSE